MGEEIQELENICKSLNDNDLTNLLLTKDITKQELLYLLDNRPMALFNVEKYRTKFIGLRNIWLARYQPRWCFDRSDTYILVLNYNPEWLFENERKLLFERHPDIYNRFYNKVITEYQGYGD